MYTPISPLFKWNHRIFPELQRGPLCTRLANNKPLVFCYHRLILLGFELQMNGNCTVCTILCLCYSSQHNIYETHPCHHRHQKFVLFLCHVVFHQMIIHNCLFFLPPECEHSCICLFVSVRFLFFSSKCLGMELLGLKFDLGLGLGEGAK